MKNILIIGLLSIGCSNEVVMGETSYVSSPTDSIQSEPDRLNAVWTISDQFTNSQIETIIQAGNDWNTVTNGRVNLTFQVSSIDSSQTFTITKEKLDDNCCAGITSNTRDQIKIDASEYEDDVCIGKFWHIAAHELGHTLGIDHGGSGLMKYKRPDCYAQFTKDDVNLFLEANP